MAYNIRGKVRLRSIKVSLQSVKNKVQVHTYIYSQLCEGNQTVSS